MLAIFKYSVKLEDKAPEIKYSMANLYKIEILNLGKERLYYMPKQFCKATQLDMKKLINISKKLENFKKEYRVIKVMPDSEASMMKGIPQS